MSSDTNIDALVRKLKESRKHQTMRLLKQPNNPLGDIHKVDVEIAARHNFRSTRRSVSSERKLYPKSADASEKALIKSPEKILNKTFVQMHEKLGFDIKLTYIKKYAGLTKYTDSIIEISRKDYFRGHGYPYEH